MAALSFAKPTTQPAPADPPTTAPAVSAKSTVGPSRESVKKLPTPAELIAQIKARKQEQARLPKVAYFDLSGPLAEKPADFSWFGDDPNGVTLRVLIDRLEHARQDKDIRGVLITLGDSELNLSQAMELRDELNALRHEGKRSFVYADSYDTTSYLAACGATDVCMMEGGDIMIPGIGFETMFAKGLLDKVGVNADFVQIGEYKGADEEYTRTEASPELRGELNKLADSLYQQIVDTISFSRNLSDDDVKQLVDDALIPGKIAKNRGLIDHLVDIDGLRSLMADELGRKVDLLRNYGESPREQVDLSSPLAFLSFLSHREAPPTRPSVAIIYAEGTIIDGSSGDGLFSQSGNIGSDTMREALRTADRDDKIEAVVIRIDSPGGSALASEAMWQAARRVAKHKPVIVSVGSMAASGGYYLASSGDYIFADPTAIVGSIGVVGGKFVLHDLFAKLGLSSESFLRGRNADLFSQSTEWTDRQRHQVTEWMRQTYDQFTDRVMTTRQGKIKDIDAVARGRIFSAKQALDLGMVDKIGGVQDAIRYAAAQADLKPEQYDVRVLPPARTFADILNGNSSDEDSKMPFAPRITISPDSIVRALPPAVRGALGQELQLLSLLQQRPVILATPYVLILK
jgi:protease-4